MKQILNGQKMNALDKETIEKYGIKQEILIEKAALMFLDALKDDLKREHTISVFCGKGNNGADGLAVFRMLSLGGFKTYAFVSDDGHEASGGFKYELSLVKNYNLEIIHNLEEVPKSDVYIDALFGTGLNRELSGASLDCISFLNNEKKKGARVFGLDVPSGISSEDGRIMGDAVFCDKTVTFGFHKLSHILFPGRNYAGQVIVKDIGIYDFDNKKGRYLLEEDMLSELPERPLFSNKGSFGRLLVIAGSKEMAGASCLAGASAYAVGAGLVSLYIPEENREILQGLLPEAIVKTYDKPQENDLVEELNKADAVVLGPGIGMDRNAEILVDLVLKNASVPVILDADALNIISKNPERLRLPHPELVLTPHPGEMARLLDASIPYVLDNSLRISEEFSRDYNVIMVLKGATTIISNPFGDTYFNITGNSGMATGGSGDVLAGMIGGLAAQLKDCKKAVPLAVLLHGMAGNKAAEKYGEYSMKAGDLIEGLRTIKIGEGKRNL